MGAGDQPLPVHRQRQPLADGGAGEGLLHRRLRHLPHLLVQGGRPHSAVRRPLREVGPVRQQRAPHPGMAPGGRSAGRVPLRRLADARVLQAIHPRRGLGRQRVPGLSAPDSRTAVARRPGRGPEDRIPAGSDPLRGALRHPAALETILAGSGSRRPRAAAPSTPAASTGSRKRRSSRSTEPSGSTTATTWPASTPTIATTSGDFAGRSSTARRPAGDSTANTIPTSPRAPNSSSTVRLSRLCPWEH